MKREFFKPGRADADKLAEEIFAARTGLKRQGKKVERMKRDAEKVREQIESAIDLRCEYAYFEAGDFSVSGDELSIDDIALKCRFFEEIQENEVKGVYLYACTAGDYSFPEWKLMDQLYADIWGDAYIDASRMLMEDRIRGLIGDDCRLSESFGPGFYGMDVIENLKFPQLIDFDAIGIGFNSSGIMIPIKSCTGLYFTVTPEYKGAGPECRACRGNHENCSICKVFTEKYGDIALE